ncbi:ribonuclease D [Pasteurellaceae bacterium 15-036681]|nr:ribonuclease D [Pasteurellaceae bacterium 15-036681]
MNNELKPIWIDNDQKLSEICAQACQKEVVALDTEFVRIRSYYPKLGLIQLFDGQTVALIDPLKINDFEPFQKLLADQSVLKVLHACGEDLEVFQHHFQVMPSPMLDTQVMAGFAGIGVSMGFAKIVEHYLQIELDKGASRTDWLARPLSQKQLEYAAADVVYLLPIFEKLRQDLSKTLWEQAVKEECDNLLTKRQSSLDLDKAYKDIGNAWMLDRPQLAVLKVLAKWRIEEAQKRDLAVNFIVKEQNLLQIAKLQPKHTSTMLEFMHPNEVRIHGKKILWLVEQGKSIQPENYPQIITRIIDEVGYKQSFKSLQNHIKQIVPADLAVELLASKRQLNQLFKWHRNGENSEKLPELLVGWRREYGLQLLTNCLKTISDDSM